MSKYEQLNEHLKEMNAGQWHAKFSEIERLLGVPLPKSAFRYPAWWSNNPEGHSHSRSWIEAGWKTEDLNLTAQTITFRRTSSGRSEARAGSPFGLMKGTITLLLESDLTQPIDAEWKQC